MSLYAVYFKQSICFVVDKDGTKKLVRITQTRIEELADLPASTQLYSVVNYQSKLFVTDGNLTFEYADGQLAVNEQYKSSYAQFLDIFVFYDLDNVLFYFKNGQKQVIYQGELSSFKTRSAAVVYVTVDQKMFVYSLLTHRHYGVLNEEIVESFFHLDDT